MYGKLPAGQRNAEGVCGNEGLASTTVTVHAPALLHSRPCCQRFGGVMGWHVWVWVWVEVEVGGGGVVDMGMDVSFSSQVACICPGLPGFAAVGSAHQ